MGAAPAISNGGTWPGTHPSPVRGVVVTLHRMAPYSPQVVRHLAAPVGAGEMPHPDAVGESGAEACGDVPILGPQFDKVSEEMFDKFADMGSSFMDGEANPAKFQELVTETNTKMQSFMSEDQFKKYQDIQQRQWGGGRRQGSGDNQGGQGGQGGQTPVDDLRVRAEAVVGQGFPVGETEDCQFAVGTGQQAQIRFELMGGGVVGGDHQQRAIVLLAGRQDRAGEAGKRTGQAPPCALLAGAGQRNGETQSGKRHQGRSGERRAPEVGAACAGKP